MTTPLVYLTGRYIPQGEARLTLHDAGFVLGATATDLCRTFRQRPYRLAEHLARFRRSCDAARIPQPVADADLTGAVEHLISHNAALLGAGGELAVVLFATPGPIGYYLGEPGGMGDGPPTLGIHTFPLPFDRYRSLFTHGARLVIPEVRHVPPASVDPRLKQRSRLHWWLATRQAQDIEPGSQPLLLDHAGHVTETAGANFLIVRAGHVLSPEPGAILGGVSLGVVRELCEALGIPFAERPLTREDCLAADEALVTSTPFCLAGVRGLDGREFPWPGPVTERLLARWSQEVGIDIREQILSASGAAGLRSSS